MEQEKPGGGNSGGASCVATEYIVLHKYKKGSKYASIKAATIFFLLFLICTKPGFYDSFLTASAPLIKFALVVAGSS